MPSPPSQNPPGEPGDQPLSRRVAVIDIGTNSTRLLVADVTGTTVSEVERLTTVTRLGRGVDHSGRLSADAIEAVCETVAAYVDLIASSGAETTSVIATSAVRDAENGSAFVAELRERFALDAEVFDGDIEAQTTYLGTTADRSGEETLLVVDIGGGSTELIIGRGKEPLFHRSLQAGVVRHTERMLASNPPNASELEQLADDLGRLIARALEGQEIPEIVRGVAVAGTPASLVAVDLGLEPYDPELVEGHVLQLGTIQHWLSKLSSMPLEERQQVTGLHPDRAEAIVAGLVILIEIMRTFNLEEVEVSERDILHGGAIRVAAAL
ncbi:MAG: Ppx/GppA phosphatase family protein [Solirubrobacterales bacterium]